MFISQGAIHGQTQQLTLVVAHDGYRVSKGISSRDRAADSILQILQVGADADFLRIRTGLNQKNIQLLFVFRKFVFAHGFEVNVDKVLGIEDIIIVVPCFRNHPLGFLLRGSFYGHRALKRFGNLHIKFFHRLPHSMQMQCSFCSSAIRVML